MEVNLTTGAHKLMAHHHSTDEQEKHLERVRKNSSRYISPELEIFEAFNWEPQEP